SNSVVRGSTRTSCCLLLMVSEHATPAGVWAFNSAVLSAIPAIAATSRNVRRVGSFVRWSSWSMGPLNEFSDFILEGILEQLPALLRSSRQRFREVRRLPHGNGRRHRRLVRIDKGLNDNRPWRFECPLQYRGTILRPFQGEARPSASPGELREVDRT